MEEDVNRYCKKCLPKARKLWYLAAFLFFTGIYIGYLTFA